LIPIQVSRLATKTTITAQYAALAEKISKLRVCVKQSAVAKTAVNIAITNNRDTISAIEYSTAIGTVKVVTAKNVVRMRDAVATLSAEKYTTFSSVDLSRSH
jgi:triosephosphate isomerase